MSHADTPITRDDIEASLRSFKDDIDRSADDARSKAIPAGILLVILVVVIAYLLGKRVGRTKSTVVEIRRI
jgi:hypothetical protein